MSPCPYLLGAFFLSGTSMIISTKINLEHTLNISDNGIYTAQYKGMTLTSAYQPIFDIHNRKIGAEALLRAFDSKGNPIPANVVFHDISVSEQDIVNSNLCRIIHIHNFSVLKKKYTKKRHWHLFLNLPPLACEDLACGWSDELYSKKKLKSLNVSPDKIVIEFVESQYDSNYILSLAAKKLKQRGFNIAYDDFVGSQHDNERLKSISPEIVKVDISLLNEYMSGNQEPITNALISASKAGAKTLAEGIENKATLEAMRALNFDYFQGYYLGMPEPLNI
jgi:EAL domain-containing protein (putative c-di-GMP-specific phosphodiesterase class I)